MPKAEEIVTAGDELENEDVETEGTLDDALNDALDGLTDETTDTAEETNETAETTESKERERNPDGTFKKAGESEETVETSETETKETKQVAESQETTETKETTEVKSVQPEVIDGRDITKPPNTWKGEAQAKYSELPREVRAEIHRREEDMFKGIEQYKTAAAFGSDIARQLQPHRELLEQHQLTPSNLLHAALEFEKVMRGGTDEQKIAMLQNIAKTYKLIKETDAEGKEITPDPKYQALETELSGIKKQLTEAEQRREQETVRREWETFKADPKHSLHSMVQQDMVQLLTNKQAENLSQAYHMAVLGNEAALKSLESEYEFIGQVKDDVLQIIKSGLGADLKSAYDKAVWINPVTQAKLIARQHEAERKQAAEKAAAAKKANRTNVTPRATPQGKTSGKGTTDDALNAALDEAGIQ